MLQRPGRRRSQSGCQCPMAGADRAVRLTPAGSKSTARCLLTGSTSQFLIRRVRTLGDGRPNSPGVHHLLTVKIKFFRAGSIDPAKFGSSVTVATHVPDPPHLRGIPGATHPREPGHASTTGNGAWKANKLDPNSHNSPS